jgi:hypothetical protein
MAASAPNSGCLIVGGSGVYKQAAPSPEILEAFSRKLAGLFHCDSNTILLPSPSLLPSPPPPPSSPSRSPSLRLFHLVARESALCTPTLLRPVGDRAQTASCRSGSCLPAPCDPSDLLCDGALARRQWAHACAHPLSSNRDQIIRYLISQPAARWSGPRISRASKAVR